MLAVITTVAGVGPVLGPLHFRRGDELVRQAELAGDALVASWDFSREMASDTAQDVVAETPAAERAKALELVAALPAEQVLNRVIDRTRVRFDRDAIKRAIVIGPERREPPPLIIGRISP